MPAINWGDAPAGPINWGDPTTWRDVRLSVGTPETENLRNILRANPPDPNAPPRTWEEDWSNSPFFQIFGAPVQWALDAPADIGFAVGEAFGEPADPKPAPAWLTWLGVGAGVLVIYSVVKAR
jgi:hypothetical protein